MVLVDATPYVEQLQTLFQQHITETKYLTLNESLIDVNKFLQAKPNHYRYVGLNDKDEIIGYFSFYLKDRKATSPIMFSFTENKMLFGRLFRDFLDLLFMELDVHILCFDCHIHNPIYQTYSRLLKKYGGVQMPYPKSIFVNHKLFARCILFGTNYLKKRKDRYETNN